MEKSPLVASPETAAAMEVVARFRSLVDNEDVGAIKQMQHLIYMRQHWETWFGLELNLRDIACCSHRGFPKAELFLSKFHKTTATDLEVVWGHWLTYPLTRIFALCKRLGRLQDSNAVLTHFNECSEQCFAEVSNDFAGKTRLVKSMKADLDHIFLKLRSMKSRLVATYPDAFPDGAMAKTMDQRPDLESPLD